MYWGISPALDLFEDIKTDHKAINILLIGGSDARHVLKTLSKKRLHEGTQINFYIMEVLPEVYAKELLLLNIALQSIKHLGLVQKTRMFMEIYGNTLMRPTSAKYLMSRARCLIDMITDLEAMKKLMPNINLDLKYKERDYMENIFKFWLCGDSFDVLDCWDRRLRKDLGVRYDTRNAAFDWDLHMRLHYVGANVINSQEYQSFRRNGVAFTWLESEVTKTNRSMVTGIIPNGDHFGHYGYLGDMQTGPFITWGIECSDDEFTKQVNHAYKYRATDVTERNLREIFHELEYGTEYAHQATTSYNLGTTIMQISELKVVDTGYTPAGRYDNKYFRLEGVEINFMSLAQLTRMQYKDNYKQFFDCIYFANNCVRHMDDALISHIAKDNCVLIVENQVFVVTYREKELEEFYNMVKSKLEKVQKAECPCDYKKDSYIKYIINN